MSILTLVELQAVYSTVLLAFGRTGYAIGVSGIYFPLAGSSQASWFAYTTFVNNLATTVG